MWLDVVFQAFQVLEYGTSTARWLSIDDLRVSQANMMGGTDTSLVRLFVVDGMVRCGLVLVVSMSRFGIRGGGHGCY
jgi:hypothetical protein